MALLIDEILSRTAAVAGKVDAISEDGTKPAGDHAAEFMTTVRAALRDLRGRSVVRATNIYQWLRTSVGGQFGNHLEGLECCFPPFPSMWVEWTGAPLRSNVVRHDGRIGCLAVTCPRDDDKKGWEVAILPAFMTDRGFSMTRRFTVSLLDEDGNCKGTCFKDWEGCVLRLDEVPESEYQLGMDTTLVVLQTFSFMNCMGVGENVGHPSSTPMQKKWNRKAEKDGKKPLPLVSFTTVDIGPLFCRRKRNGNVKPEPTGRHNRDHWTRGHVKHYPGLLLFGRIPLDKPGIWCPAFRSGRAKGEVRRTEYTVQTPESPGAVPLAAVA